MSIQYDIFYSPDLTIQNNCNTTDCVRFLLFKGPLPNHEMRKYHLCHNQSPLRIGCVVMEDLGQHWCHSVQSLRIICMLILRDWTACLDVIIKVSIKDANLLIDYRSKCAYHHQSQNLQ